jgi:hypothetical protein
MALSIEKAFINPNYSTKMLFELKKSLIVLYITFTYILENAISNEHGL